MMKYTGLVTVLLVSAALTYSVCDRLSQSHPQLPIRVSQSSMPIVPLTQTTTTISSRSNSLHSIRLKSHSSKMSGKPSAQLDLRHVPNPALHEGEVDVSLNAPEKPAFLDLTGGLGLLPTAIVLPKAQETKVAPPIFDTKTQKKSARAKDLNSKGQVQVFL